METMDASYCFSTDGEVRLRAQSELAISELDTHFVYSEFMDVQQLT